MTAKNTKMDFVPMSSINKKPDSAAHKCSDWVATEKVHGSSFQFYTDDGVKVHLGSRRQNLGNAESFVRCNLKQIQQDYEECVRRAWQSVQSGDGWAAYTDSIFYGADDEEDEDDGGNDNNDHDDDDNVEEGCGIGSRDDCSTNCGEDSVSETRNISKDKNEKSSICQIRVYGELYGGGGIETNIKTAVQKEIIYCDDFRFYVFGLTINRKWVTISELNVLCEDAGFPYYAKPVCEPRATVEDLKQFLVESGFMNSRSSLTERTYDDKTVIEGVVITPLVRPDFRLHAVKYLAPSFNDVRNSQFGKTVTANYCTKQRYHSVISKLDIHEREDTQMVVDMFIADIIKESNKNVADKMKGVWAKVVTQWLQEDEYYQSGEGKEWILIKDNNNKGANNNNNNNNNKSKRINYIDEEKREKREKAKDEAEEEDLDDFGLGLFDL